jgi:hypothetical protein
MSSIVSFARIASSYAAWPSASLSSGGAASRPTTTSSGGTGGGSPPMTERRRSLNHSIRRSLSGHHAGAQGDGRPPG